MYYPRFLEAEIKKSIKNNPVTAVIGPRQCGKSTLVKQIISELPEVLYLDLEKPSDLQKLEEAEWFLSTQKEKTICLDEIQRKPEIFPLLRSLSDEWGGNGHFVLLGSASRDLLKQSSETLAGRISYKRLTPFLFSEIEGKHTQEEYIEKGGFPRSLLAPDKQASMEWRQDFITTFLERDLMLWSGFSPATMRKLWQMLAYSNGQITNYSTLGKSLGVSHTTIHNYVDLLAETFMVNILQPFIPNINKRVVKSPKIYVSDSGITNALIHIGSFEQLMSHPTFGSVWEGVVLSNLKGHYPNYNFYFYRTSNGSEIDFVVENAGNIVAIECKGSLSPVVGKGFYSAIEDIKPVKTMIACPVKSGWPMKPGIDVVSLTEAANQLGKYLN